MVTTALAIASSSDRETIAKANALVRNGDILRAESFLKSASEANPKSELLHEALGELFFKQRKFEDAVRELTLANQINPDSRHYSMMLAGALINWQHFGVAVEFLQATQSKFGEFPEFHHYLAIAYFNMNRIPDAKAEAERTLGISPDFDRAQLLLAMCQMAQGENDEALANYRDLVKKRPTNPIYWATLAQSLTKQGEKYDAEALEAGRRALALAPNNPVALSATGAVLTRMGSFTAARPLYERLVRLDPSAIAPHAALAHIYSRLGNQALARKERNTLDRLRAQAGSGSLPKAQTPQFAFK
jgi:predicted Zn-dependent protease